MVDWCPKVVVVVAAGVLAEGFNARVPGPIVWGTLSSIMTGEDTSESQRAACASSCAAKVAAALFTSAIRIEEAECSCAAKAALFRSIASLCA